mgnify:CR=1 FL=1
MTKPSNPVSHYDLIDLRVFIAVAEEGNVSRGAERCHLAPSTASLRLKGLEVAIGVPLLQRQARGVTLAPAGRVMLDHARRCVAQLEQMHADLLPFTQGLTGHLTFFANNNAISTHLPEDLSRYFATHPAVRITLKERLSADIVAAVADGEADIGVVAMEAPHPALDYWPYRIDQLVLLAPPGSAVGKLRTVGFADCLQLPFISLQQGAALHQTCQPDHMPSKGHQGRGRHRVLLLRHGRGPALARCRGLEHLANIGLHQQADIAAKLAQAAGDQAEQAGEFN